MNHDEINETLAAFHHSGTRHLCCAPDSDYWYTVDDDTYSGEPVDLFNSPLGAVKDWWEKAQVPA